MTAEPVSEQTWLIGRVGNEELASEVVGWWMDPEGVTPLTAGEWSGSREGEIFKGTTLDAAKVATLRKLVEVSERCTTAEARADLRRIADWVTNWEPGDPGLSLGGGNGG
ncbi:hypothetical protein TUSST3_83630 [Streptomyces sp. TUS-ST3]|uniref:hypothetical protein n=1 Tax=Streptomyces sp. TUS-ST3 TaxID=3025591 RepID=UPI00235B57EE|nr:hypothetical protein [Streptomyces sp. TUS-ST3]GLP71744.1 hypothetical protein TUSST3_83630 [Streptomyces sp. TUS-ST3]